MTVKPILGINRTLSLSFIMQAPSHIPTFLSAFEFNMSYRFVLVFSLDSLKYLSRSEVMGRSQHGVLT